MSAVSLNISCFNIPRVYTISGFSFASSCCISARLYPASVEVYKIAVGWEDRTKEVLHELGYEAQALLCVKLSADTQNGHLCDCSGQELAVERVEPVRDAGSQRKSASEDSEAAFAIGC